MMKIEYVKGDATAPTGDGQKIIVHVCNDLGKWGKGFVLAISRRWKTPEKAYRQPMQVLHRRWHWVMCSLLRWMAALRWPI